MSSASSKVTRSIAQKLKDLNELLLSRPIASHIRPTERESFLNSSALAQHLFGRASADFLENKDSKTLVHITEVGMEQLEHFNNNPEKPVVHIELHHDHAALYLVLVDRPFIINTITETVHEFGADITELLHPIVKSGNYQISFSYLEITGCSPDELTKLAIALREAFSALRIVTEDFTAMLVRADTLSRLIESPQATPATPQSERREVFEFLRWLADGGFVFLGHAMWKEGSFNDGPVTSLGFYKCMPTASLLLKESRAEVERLSLSGAMIGITRLRTKSTVQHRSRLLHITIEEPGSDSSAATIHTFAGMLTSRARGQESSSVPLIRRKLQLLIELEQATPNSYHYKNLVNFVDRMPKEDALRLEIDTLHQVVKNTLTLHSRHGTKVALLTDPAGIAASFLIVMPRDRFNTSTRRALQKYVEDLVGAPPGSSEYLLDVSDKSLARFYFSVAPASEGLPEINQRTLEADISRLTKSWKESLEETFEKTREFKDKADVSKRYADAFPGDYQAGSTGQEALADIVCLEKLTDSQPVCLGLTPSSSTAKDLTLNLYQRSTEIPLSRALPILENAGLEVIHERAFSVTPQHSPTIFIHRFLIRPKNQVTFDETRFEKFLSPGLTAVFLNQAANDPLNYLFLGAGLDVRAIALLRAYSSLLAQANKFATRHAIYNALAGIPSAAMQLWEMFVTKFDPTLGLARSVREEKLTKLDDQYQDLLSTVHDINQDRILRGLGILLANTLRTNFYTTASAVALKIHSAKTEILPQPRPLYEIFVSSPVVEGIHLRSSMVARGGIRWSDRKDDYRTEVLGLMKTQKIKNVVIVPSGAKGGFIVKQMPDDSSQVKAAVENAYREYIRALLSLTDNRIDDRVVTPENVIAYDGEDPYFVVAADKGTATFSDIANKIAVEEFNFWLGDAFASGGSNGYDHKKYAITARGAWECTKRHFAEAGINYEQQPFSVIGIGDMSGDVFGNGLLLSRQIKLLAAFDHRSIFIDPSPDPEKSFQERSRLFALKGSSWNDYDRSTMSPGGGIFGRLDKEITITKEMRESLSIAEDVPAHLNGEQLISLILKAKADLLWNGGIGTYVKSSEESNSEVNDSTNDRLRVNAEELRVRVVAEGGNLGFTQRARVTFAQCGGHINTDAIDNSAGVDLSDHEVNLKILFGKIVRDGRLTTNERNDLLRSLSEDVCEAVLSHNRSHALAISIGVDRSKKNVEYLKTLIKQLSKQGYVNRTLEALPDDEELDERARRHEGLTRPEIAVLIATVKMWVQDFLIQSKLVDDPFLKPMLVEYFPKVVAAKYQEDLLAHPLAREIINTQVSNKVIDTVGVSFIHRMSANQAADPVNMIKCVLATEALLPLQSLRKEFERFDSAAGNQRFMNLSGELRRTLRATAGWMLSAHDRSMTLSTLVALYQQPFKTLITSIHQTLGTQERFILEQRLERDKDINLPDFERYTLALFPIMIPVLEMLYTSRTSNKEVALVGEVYSQLLHVLQVNRYVVLGQPIEAKSRWENELLVNSYEEIRRGLSAIACALLEKGATSRESVLQIIKRSPGYDRLIGTIQEISEDAPNAASLSVLAKQLRMFTLD